MYGEYTNFSYRFLTFWMLNKEYKKRNTIILCSVFELTQNMACVKIVIENLKVP